MTTFIGGQPVTLPGAFVDTLDQVDSILDEAYDVAVVHTAPDPVEHRCDGIHELDAIDLVLCEALSELAWADQLVAWWADTQRDEAITRTIFQGDWEQRTGRT